MKRKILVALFALLVVPIVAFGDAPLQTFNGTLAATGVTPSLSLAGQSTCSVVLSGTWSGTATFQASSDNGATWNTVTNINSGTATSNGTYGGNIAPYLTRFRVSWTRVSGTLGYFEACSGTVSANGGLGPNPVFTGSVVGNAGAATPSPAPTGYYGPFVVAQATAAPTAQPGNTNITGTSQAAQFKVGTGASTTIPTAINLSTNVGGGSTTSNIGTDSTCSIVGVNGTFFSVESSSGVKFLCLDGSGNLGALGVVVSATHNTCGASSGMPCKFAWTCTMSSGVCTTTQTVPASSVCTTTPNVTPIISATNLVSTWVTLSSTTLTIHVSDELGAASSVFSGNGNCL